jgi:hypothetical protein
MSGRRPAANPMGQGGGAVEEEREDGGRRETEPNPTQEQIGDGEDRPADVSWDEGDWGETPEESPLA